MTGRNLTALFVSFPGFILSLSAFRLFLAGLTKYRDGLYPLEQFTAEDCAAVISQVDRFAVDFKKRNGIRLAYCSDEFYLKAGLQIPDEDYYDGYPQLENGVGMIASMSAEFNEELDYLDEYDRDGADEVSIATGAAAYRFISSLADTLTEKTGIKIHVYKIRNNFFGETVTVAGLVTGGDIAEQLDGMPLGKRLILPYVMLRAERDLFLDGMTPAQLSERLAVPVTFSESDGASFIRSVLAG